MAIYVAAVDGMTSHDAADVTRLETALLSQEGVVGYNANDLLVEAQGTPDLTVKVNPGSCFVLRDAHPGNDNTLRFWHVIVTAITNVTITAADSSNPRIDIICVKIDTGATPDATASNVATLVAVAGTPAGSPSAPAVPANHLKIAEVSVPALDTTISSGQITDSRPFIGLQLPITEGYRLKDTGASLDGRVYEDSSGNIFVQSTKSGGAIKIDMSTNTIQGKGKGGDSFTPITSGGIDNLTDGATIAIDGSKQKLKRVTLGGNRTFGTPTNMNIGDAFQLDIIQPGAGGPYTVTWFPNLNWDAGTTPTLTTAASKVDSFVIRKVGGARYQGYIAGQGIAV